MMELNGIEGNTRSPDGLLPVLWPHIRSRSDPASHLARLRCSAWGFVDHWRFGAVGPSASERQDAQAAGGFVLDNCVSKRVDFWSN